MSKKYVLLSLVFAFALQVYAQRQDEMKKTVAFLASQELGGRFPGTAGDTLASEFILERLRGLRLKPVLKGKKKKAYYHDFTYGKEEERTTHNILAVLPGKDKQLKNEYIVVGSHYDHLGMGGKGSGSRRPDTMQWFWNWQGTLKRCVHLEVSSSPSSVQRSRDWWAPSILWNG